MRIEQALPEQFRPKRDAQTLYRLYALLTLVKGRDVTLENVHDAWASWQSASDPDHEAIRPFIELDEETREKDRPYMMAIQELGIQLEKDQSRGGS
ncbi:hypothetical protein V1639_15505 [Pseudarthrobacter sp. J75]|uniref:DUF7701 domain-containing protein n=1 Tax=unclassified Pseudarthrobacter TaxID=2647000 RepID=UPI002E81815A|nr:MULTISPECIES: hypothetical protein [unclassified Pseudarthrobacter]MEE2524727.1 hypothetical protein [Pseudarthrobacter sp. J47]MEE2530427.1 hypothetical protein [Pseudarthrobacter sp. J75]